MNMTVKQFVEIDVEKALYKAIDTYSADEISSLIVKVISTGSSDPELLAKFLMFKLQNTSLKAIDI